MTGRAPTSPVTQQHEKSIHLCQVTFSSTGHIDVCGNRLVDLWEDHGPARRLNGTAYEEEVAGRDLNSGPISLRAPLLLLSRSLH